MRRLRVQDQVTASDVDEAVAKAIELATESGLETIYRLETSASTAILELGETTSSLWDVEIEGFTTS